MIIIVEWLARLVFVILLLLSIWSVTIMIDRKRLFSLIVNLRPLAEKIKSGKIAEFHQEVKTSYQNAFTIFTEISEIQDTDKVERSFGVFLMMEKEKLEKGLAILGTLGSTAPFIGLLGTVLGIIVSFGKLSTGNGGTDAVMYSLAEALILTAVGLVVAIPAVIAFNYFSRKSKFVLNELVALKDLYLTYRK